MYIYALNYIDGAGAGAGAGHVVTVYDSAGVLLGVQPAFTKLDLGHGAYLAITSAMPNGQVGAVKIVDGAGILLANGEVNPLTTEGTVVSSDPTTLNEILDGVEFILEMIEGTSPNQRYTATALSQAPTGGGGGGGGGEVAPAGDRPFSVAFGYAHAALSTVGYTLYDADLNLYAARTTMGVEESPTQPGTYSIAADQVPDELKLGGFRIEWDTGEVGPALPLRGVEDVSSAGALTGADFTAIADAILTRPFGEVMPQPISSDRNTLQALRLLRNRRRSTGATLEIMEEDDTTPAWTANQSGTATSVPTDVDPT
jgi:hypothetical protein